MKIKSLVLSNGELLEKEINNTLETLQEIVGGYIEVPLISREFRNQKIDVIINSDGKFIEGLRPEIAIVNKETKEVLDVVYGNCIFASHNNEGDTIALNNKQIAVIREALKVSAVLKDNGENKKDTLVRVLLV